MTLVMLLTTMTLKTLMATGLLNMIIQVTNLCFSISFIAKPQTKILYD